MTQKSIIKKYLPKGIETSVTANVICVPVTAEQLVVLCQELYVTHQLHLYTVKAVDDRQASGMFKIYYVFGAAGEMDYLALCLSVEDKTAQFPSIVEIIYEASFYEREIHTFFGLTPLGNPDLRPLVLQENWPTDKYPLRKDFAWNHRPDQVHKTYDFHVVKGEGIYEVPLGPIYTGVSEPAHFHLSMIGEEIAQLELQLGYSHRGIEKLFEHLPLAKKPALAEQVVGDTSFTYALAFCQAIEQLGEVTVPTRAQYLRVIYSELERLANHCGNIGTLIADTGFIFGGSNGSRQREQMLQVCDKLTGSRYLRGVCCVGGVTKDIDVDNAIALVTELAAFKESFNEWIAITDNTETAMERLITTGVVKQQVAFDHGMVGIAAHASGLSRDCRLDHPYAAYGKLPVKLIQESTGDSYARYRVRVREVLQSIKLITSALKDLPEGEVQLPSDTSLAHNACAIGAAEGWRGEIVYFVTTDDNGAIARVGISDPSFPNSQTLPFAAIGNLIDFSITSSSFSLSSAGFDR